MGRAATPTCSASCRVVADIRRLSDAPPSRVNHPRARTHTTGWSVSLPTRGTGATVDIAVNRPEGAGVVSNLIGGRVIHSSLSDDAERRLSEALTVPTG